MLFLERASDSVPGGKKSKLLPSILQFYNFLFFFKWKLCRGDITLVTSFYPGFFKILQAYSICCIDWNFKTRYLVMFLEWRK